MPGMNTETGNKPVVLVLAGHDPCGGAGIQADIESVAAAGCHAMTAITSLTAQNTARVGGVRHQDPADFEEQIRLLLEDMPVQACKIGLVADTGLLGIIEQTLTQHLQGIPVVLDPVVTAGSGHVFLEPVLCRAIAERLLPLATVATPNSIEARELAGRDDVNEAGAALVDRGAGAVLVTGGHENDAEIINTLYRHDAAPLRYTWERLPGSFHGSGCTLSSHLAARLALGDGVEAAAQAAQEYTWGTLRHAGRYGSTQLHPDRQFRCAR